MGQDEVVRCLLVVREDRTALERQRPFHNPTVRRIRLSTRRPASPDQPHGPEGVVAFPADAPATMK